jgi:small subunit ribosomal protein S5
MARKKFTEDKESSEGLDENVISINRCSKVVKGGRNFSFGALVVVGNKNGKVGYGYGKANEVADAIKKGSEAAKKNMVSIPMKGGTIPHPIVTKFRGAQILLRPASEGTGLIAGGSMRAILDLAGVKDVLAKSLGSNNPFNVVKATMQAIESLRDKEYVFAKRGLSQ